MNNKDFRPLPTKNNALYQFMVIFKISITGSFKGLGLAAKTGQYILGSWKIIALG